MAQPQSNPPSVIEAGAGMGTFTLLLFASASSYCGNIESLNLPAPTTLVALVEELERRYPGVGSKVLKSCQLVRNLDYVDVDVSEVVEGKKDLEGRRVGEAVVIKVGDEVGVVPPVSSG